MEPEATGRASPKIGPPLVPTDPPEVEEILWAGWSGHLAFDVGARFGENIPHLKTAGFHDIVALEPDPVAYAELVARFATVCQPMWMAVSAETGMVELAQVRTRNLGGVPTLVTPGTDGMEWTPDDWDDAPKVVVQSVALDDLAGDFGWPDFVVVDTEGHEGKVLDGATEILKRGSAGWLIEFHSPGLREYCERKLAEANYRVTVVRHPHYAPQSVLWYQHGWLRAAPG